MKGPAFSSQELTVVGAFIPRVLRTVEFSSVLFLSLWMGGDCPHSFVVVALEQSRLLVYLLEL